MAKKPERNDPCRCGSGKKYKHCCQGKDDAKVTSKMGVVGLIVVMILALVLVVVVFSGGSGSENCPPGMVWSDAHQHCH